MESQSSTVESYLSVLNPEQREAVEHEGSPLLILAGAGSGKTRVITTKIAYLIAEKGIPAWNILAVTFTKKAAREMAERAVLLDERAKDAQIRTFHSFGSWFLRRFATTVGLSENFTVYDDDDMLTLLLKACPDLNRKDAGKVVHLISRAKDYCLTPESEDLDEFVTENAGRDGVLKEKFAEFYASYQSRLRSTGNVDFGDLIMLPVLILQSNEKIRKQMQRRFKVIMVDEYQDSNVAQFKFLQALSGVNEGSKTYVCVVGDDDQSIYRFRGAEVQNILSFEKQFPGTKIIRLGRNYRSTSEILHSADVVVSKNQSRLGKTLIAERGNGSKPILTFCPTQEDETKFCADLILESHKKGCPFNDWAVLYRTNAQSLGFETEFLRRKIPYTVVGSLKFYQREEIKDILSILSLTQNPCDEIAFRRIVNKPGRGIGEKTQDAIVEEARKIAAKSNNSEKAETSELYATSFSQLEENQNVENSVDDSEIPDWVLDFGDSDSTPLPPADFVKAAANFSGKATARAKKNISEFAEMMQSFADFVGMDQKIDDENEEIGEMANLAIQATETENENFETENAENHGETKRLSEFIEFVAEKSGLEQYHKEQDEIAGTTKVANIQELANNALLYPCTRKGLLDFLDAIELDRSLEEQTDDDLDTVTLITLHNTKGLEFPRVIITGMDLGIFPHENKFGEDLEEERRLFYVGITRAKNQLYLTSCSVRRLYGQTKYMEPSPFLAEAGNSFNVLGKKPAGYLRALRELNSDTNSVAVEEDFLSDLSPEDKELSKMWSKGKKVFHDDYGYGQILEGRMSEDEYVITVLFENSGRKRFIPKYQKNSLMLIKD